MEGRHRSARGIDTDEEASHKCTEEKKTLHQSLLVMEEKVKSGWVDTDCKLVVLFFCPTQTRRQHIQGCSIIHVWGSSPSPFPSHATRLTRPSQYYQEDVCLHGSD